MILNNKLYESFGDALNACDRLGYSQPVLAEVVVKKNLAFQQRLKSDEFLRPEEMRTLLGINFAFMQKSIKVIDFGGGGGFHYIIARQVLGDNYSIKWNIVETDAMCQTGAIICDESLKFFRDISSAHQDLNYVDLILASSSLQYCPDPIKSIRSMLSFGARYVYITRTPFSTGKDTLISVQSSRLSDNGPGEMPLGYLDQEILYPISFVPLSIFEAIIKEKYLIKFKVLEEHGSLSVDGVIINNYYGFFCELKPPANILASDLSPQSNLCNII